MLNKSENYNYIKDKIHAIKEEFPCLKNKSDDFAFSALTVKAIYYKNPALNLTDSDLAEIIVDGQYDGGVDFLLSDPSSETSDLVIGQSKFYEKIQIDDVINAVNKMFSFYKDMKEGHYENVNNKVQSRFLTLNAEVGEESKIHFIFATSANQNGIRKDRITKKIKDYFPDDANMDITILFVEDIIESIKELESRRPTVESGKITIDEANNYLNYGEDAVIVNISAFSLKQLYAQHNNNILSRNLRYHVPGKTIDQGISETIKNDPDSFWYKNNGITIICDDFNLDGKEVKLLNFSIINGGQTTYMIHKSKDVSENNDFYLPCKIIKTVGASEDDKNDFILKIAKATNSQKAIKTIDLKANSPEQVSFSQAMREVGIFYQTKRGEKVPNDFKAPYLNSDLAEVGKLCLAAIFQMPGSSRNKPSTLYASPYYETIFSGNQKQMQIAKISKELLYIDNYWKNHFKSDFEREMKDNPIYQDIMPFANNSRTICIAFTMFASRYYVKNFTPLDVKIIFDGMQKESNKNDFIHTCKNLGDINFVLPNNLFDNKDEYEKVLHYLFTTIITAGYATLCTIQKGDSMDASNYLKKDESYYNILRAQWFQIEKSIKEIFGEIN